MKPTLNQAGKLLEMISQSGRTAEWVQEHLIGSGAFSDLLEVDNLKEMKRGDRRRFFGLPPLNPPLLEQVGTLTIPVAPKFVASERFVRDTSANVRVKIAYLGDNFRLWFLGKIEEPRPATTLVEWKLTRLARDKEIRKEIGVEREETMLAWVYALMEQQPNGEESTDGRANIFYVKDANGVLRAVGVGWSVALGGWCVNAYPVTDPKGWLGGYRVFSCNSVTVAV